MKKTIVLVMALSLVVGCVAGATLAWLADKTTPVVNTFTTSDVDIKLEETTGETYQMIPGWTNDKDPRVTVLADSEDCYVFVKIDESIGNVTVNEQTMTFDHYLSYVIADGWTPLNQTDADNDGVADDGIYYRTVYASDADQPFQVLGCKDTTNHTECTGCVLTKSTVTKPMMDALTADTYPTLTFTAYAVQMQKNNTTPFEPQEAWEQIQAGISAGTIATEPPATSEPANNS